MPNCNLSSPVYFTTFACFGKIKKHLLPKLLYLRYVSTNMANVTLMSCTHIIDSDMRHVIFTLMCLSRTYLHIHINFTNCHSYHASFAVSDLHHITDACVKFRPFLDSDIWNIIAKPMCLFTTSLHIYIISVHDQI